MESNLFDLLYTDALAHVIVASDYSSWMIAALRSLSRDIRVRIDGIIAILAKCGSDRVRSLLTFPHTIGELIPTHDTLYNPPMLAMYDRTCINVHSIRCSKDDLLTMYAALYSALKLNNRELAYYVRDRYYKVFITIHVNMYACMPTMNKEQFYHYALYTSIAVNTDNDYPWVLGNIDRNILPRASLGDVFSEHREFYSSLLGDSRLATLTRVHGFSPNRFIVVVTVNLHYIGYINLLDFSGSDIAEYVPAAVWFSHVDREVETVVRAQVYATILEREPHLRYSIMPHLLSWYSDPEILRYTPTEIIDFLYDLGTRYPL